MIYRRILVFEILFLLVFISKNLNAQDFEVAPVSLEFSAEPGDNQTKLVTIKNHSNKKASFILSLADFLPTIKGEKKIMPLNSVKRSCANWLNINPSFFEINPSDEIQIQVKIMVPTDEYGASWCMLYIQPTIEQSSWNADKKLGAGITVSGRIGVQIYQSPKSNLNHKVKISNLTEITESNNGRVFNATIENFGEKITKCKAYLIASNIETSEEKQFAAKECEVFPKMSRVIELTLPNVLKKGTYSLAAIIDYGSKFALEGTQLLIEVKDNSIVPKVDTTRIQNDTTKVK